MILDGPDLNKLSYFISQQVEQVTCIECCKTYIAPETAPCGHTLCHVCWKKRRTCPMCSSTVNRQATKLNLPLQNLTEHINTLGETFEKVFKVKLDEFILDTPANFDSEDDPTKHVKDWLASSQNQFSAPVVTSGETPLDKAPVEVHVQCKPLVHTTNTILHSKPTKLVCTSIAQDDWDKIEAMPESDNKDKENVVGPMDIEPFTIDDNFYTMQNPRRSSRKKEGKIIDCIDKKQRVSPEKQSTKESSSESDKKANSARQNWNNVKRMRKEFSKLNKKNKNKLNVSIEMHKKTQNSINKSNIDKHTAVSEQLLEIDENTPNIENNEKSHDLCTNNDYPQRDTILEPKKLNNSSSKLETSITKTDLRCATDSSAVNLKNVTEMGHNIKFSYSSPLANKKQNEETYKINNSKIVFFKKAPLCSRSEEHKCSTETTYHYIDADPGNINSNNNIEISIKIGDTVTNILINKHKGNSVLKTSSDREIQVSLGPYNIPQEHFQANPNTRSQKKANEFSNNEIVSNLIGNTNNKTTVVPGDKSMSTKKNTASAETVTAQFEITESIERELSKIMECDTINNNQIEPCNANREKQNTQVHQSQILSTTLKDAHPSHIDDLHILNSCKTNINNVQLLKNTNQAPSEILLPSNYTIRHKYADKRSREVSSDQDLPRSKKIKAIPEKVGETLHPRSQCHEEENCNNDSEIITYETVIDQVFANIDMDFKNNHETNTQKEKNKQPIGSSEAISQTQNSKIVDLQSSTHVENISNLKDYYNQKNSENIFSIAEKDIENYETTMKSNVSTQQHIQDLLTPVVRRNLELNECTPHVDRDDESDRSVVEDTPQKTISYAKVRQNNGSSTKELQPKQKQKQPELAGTKSFQHEKAKSVINLTESIDKNNKDVTVIESIARKNTLETPLTINKFVDHIKHKSTPVAKKSLNFEHENKDVEDPEITLCPTSDIAKNTQEKEFMSKAFENTPESPRMRTLALKNINSVNNKDLCIAGSCLTASEITKLKNLCSIRKWTYVDKYTKNLTHLVVGVDDENKSQRSVKYMSALAAGKWIVSFEWVERCLKAMRWVDEVKYEVLDSTGEPGPRRSRIAKQKLFHGITFYCMPPFSVLDVDTLKGMLEAAGGRVVNELKQVSVTEDKPGPALLLAEPENTQEDRFIYLTVEYGIVPVNYEWVLNSLGNYTLGSLQDLLLCPVAILPKITSQWPSSFFARDDE